MNAPVSSFERIGRARKLTKLLDTVRTIERETGASKVESLGFWRHANEREWLSLDNLAGINPASAETRAAFLEALAKRAGVP